MATDTDAQSASDGTVDVTRLLAAVARGDREAFAALYDAVAPRVHGLVVRILIDRAQSEEVTQEVFLEIWQRAPRFDASQGSAVSWILMITHRRAVDRVRQSQAGHVRDDRIARRDVDVSFDPVSETGEVRLESERVRRALRSLSPVQREAIALAYFGGYTQSEIADHLSTPIGTVKTRLRDALKRLRDTLGVTS